MCTPISGLHIPLNEEHRGFQLLQRLGWQPWSGLGKFQSGRLAPINPFEKSLRGQASINSVLKEPTACLPEINLVIGNMSLSALVDTGSEVTCISENLCFQLQRDLVQLPVLPLKAIQIQGAFSKKSRRITKQVLLTTMLGGVAFDFCCLVIPDLLKPFIIGIDWLTEHKCIMSLEEQTLQVNSLDQVVKIPVSLTTIVKDSEKLDVSDDAEFFESYALTKESKEELIKKKVHEADLIPEHRTQLLELLTDFKDLFSEMPGLTHLYKHEITMKDEEPINRRSYPVPYALRPAVEDKLREMEEMGIIERAISAYSSPITIVKKKDNTVRICLDARGINERLVADTETPPRTEELLQKFHGRTSLSSIDLASSFWQLPLTPSSRKYTAFSYNGRTYVFKVLPFGLKTAVASFSRCMDIVLGPEVRSFTSNYIDDLLVASENFEAHLEHLRQVFQRLLDGGMTINLEKSHFVRREVPFLGHVLTPFGIRMDSVKVQAIKQFPRPTKIKHLRAFLGLCNFYKRFCKNYSDNTMGLRHLLRKKTRWEWGEKEEECFQYIKDRFIESVVLIHPDLRNEFHLDSDSSYYAIGAVLYQELENGEIGVVAFISRSLHGPELNYTTTEKELLAIVYALQKSRVYLLGNKITIRTDHKALTFLKHCRFVNDRMLRWQLFLQQFNLTIEHVKGTQNKVADILSRYPPENKGDGDKRNPLAIATFKVEGTMGLINELKHIHRLQREDLQIAKLIKMKEGEVRPNTRESRVLRNYKLINGVLLHKNSVSGCDTLEVPTVITGKLIWHYHYELGHFGALKVYNVLKRHFHWKGMWKQTKRLLGTCDLCQKTKGRNCSLEGAVQPIITREVGELISIDYFGPLPVARGGFKYLCVMLDVFSKYVKIFPMRRINAAGTLKHLREGFMKHVRVRKVLSDHGTQFTSRRWIETLEAWDIRPVFITIRHPQSNPVERYMKTLGRFFRTYCHQHHKSWLKYIKDIESCLNSTPHISTQFAPLHILTGKRPRYSLQDTIDQHVSPKEDLTLPELHEQVRRNLKRHADIRVRRQHRKNIWQFQVGDMVLLRINKPADAKAGETKKFHLIYDGPFYVTASPYVNVYELRKDPTGPVFGRYNTSNLVPYRK